ncbi:MAG: hypothetical protein ACJ8R9_24400 [Steroidobacteraceae bacterium]
MTPRNCRPGAIPITLLGVWGIAWGQSAQILQDQSDINAARRAAIDSTFTRPGIEQFTRDLAGQGICSSPPKLSSGFTLNAGAQVSYDNNPDPSTDAEGDWHAHPDLKAAYKWQRGMRFDAALDINSDRYLSPTSGNYDEAVLQTKLSFTDGRDCSAWNAFFYIKNKLSDDFATTFSHSTARTDQLSVGATGSYPFRITEGRPHRTTGGDADFVLTFDVNAGRQQATPSKLNGTIVVASFTLSRAISDDWAVSLGPAVKMTWRDSPAAHSWLSANNLVVEWTPPIPDASDRKLEIDFVESFNSVHPGAGTPSYTENDVGPSLTWSWKF